MSLENKVNGFNADLIEPEEKPIIKVSEYVTNQMGIHGACFFYGNLIPIQRGMMGHYKNPIILEEGLRGDDLASVRIHEKHHEQNPQDTESETREKTYTSGFMPNRHVSYHKAA